MNNLRKIRGKHQIGLEELAGKMGVTKQILCLSEKRRISARTATKAAEALEENVFDILGSDVFVVMPKTEEDVKIIKAVLDELCLSKSKKKKN